MVDEGNNTLPHEALHPNTCADTVKIQVITPNDIASNAVVVGTMLVLWLLFLLLLYHARKQDEMAVLATGPVWLETNDVTHHGRYEVSITTGP